MIEPQTEIKFLKGVGPARAAIFEKLGVLNATDLLEYYPRDWKFLPEPVQIGQVKKGDDVTVVGMVESLDFLQYKRPPRLEVYINDGSGCCRVVWFNGQYWARELMPGVRISVTGKVQEYKHQLQIVNPQVKVLEIEQNVSAEDLSGPIYPASANLSSAQIRRIIKPALKGLLENIPEFFTEEFLKHEILIPRQNAYQWIHDPKDPEQLRRALRRLKFDELFLMQLGLAVRRYKMESFAPAISMLHSDALDSRIRRRFPFMLTEDQDKVIREIADDMMQAKPMNRLLQGDVGSGKTVVAVYAALMAVANKTQVAMMAPTEILAEQHYLSMIKFLEGSQVSIELVTGGITGASRRELIERIKSGKVNIVVGTVAILQEDIEFDNLGMVIIDEQHKFGVHQRGMLRKGHAPHCLVMTATPIPRTLAMTAFGDLDVSIIRHRPPGRGKTTTRFVAPHDRKKAFEFIRSRLVAGRQAYFVYPRISNAEVDSDIKAAADEFEVLNDKIFPEFGVELLHGRMSSDEKKAVMKRFREGETRVLVSTVVIEVGVDVPNATIMVVEGANRFGLAQLHQLRGRIGRGQSNSYCLLFSDSENEIAKKRLEMMVRSNDGFDIAEYDLSLRGPGELFSTRQHGLPDLKIADIVADYDLLVMARKDAFQMVKDDPSLSRLENRTIRKVLIEKFGEKLGLIDIA